MIEAVVAAVVGMLVLEERGNVVVIVLVAPIDGDEVADGQPASGWLSHRGSSHARGSLLGPDGGSVGGEGLQDLVGSLQGRQLALFHIRLQACADRSHRCGGAQGVLELTADVGRDSWG